MLRLVPHHPNTKVNDYSINQSAFQFTMLGAYLLTSLPSCSVVCVCMCIVVVVVV